MKAFLSSTYIDLVEYRRAVVDALDRLRVQVGRMEIFGALPKEPIAACLDEVADCDLFIGVYAHRYGHVPAGTQTSITELELRHARRLGKPVFCFVVADTQPWPPAMIEGDIGQTMLKDLKKSLSEALVYDTFDSPGNLALKVVTSVSNHVMSSHQRGAREPELLERIYATFSSHHNTLFGRAAEMDGIARLLSPTSPLKGVALLAIGGMGKTALAREFCVTREIFNMYDLVLGAPARKRQIRIDPHLTKSANDEFGTVLQPHDFLIAIAHQLGIRAPETVTEVALEVEVMKGLHGHSALFLLDNLETIENTLEMLALLDRLCLPPTRKALITTRQFPMHRSSEFAVLPVNAIPGTSALPRIGY